MWEFYRQNDILSGIWHKTIWGERSWGYKWIKNGNFQLSGPYIRYVLFMFECFKSVHSKMAFRWVYFPNIYPGGIKGIRGKPRLLTSHSQERQRDEEVDAPVHARS